SGPCVGPGSGPVGLPGAPCRRAPATCGSPVAPEQRGDVMPLGGQHGAAFLVATLAERELDEPPPPLGGTGIEAARRRRDRDRGLLAHARSRAFSRCHCTVFLRPISSVKLGTQRSVRRVFSMFTTRRRMLSMSRRFVCCASSAEPTSRDRIVANSFTRVSTPVPTLNTSPSERSDWAASTVASTASSMYVKSRVWLPSPWITGAWPANSESMNLATTPQ